MRRDRHNNCFSFVAEDLIERSAYLTSQNMKVDAHDHVIALDIAIGKTKLFYIGMSGSATTTFPIKYVIKKSFNVDTSISSIVVLDAEVIFWLTKLYTITTIYGYLFCIFHNNVHLYFGSHLP
jgi:hypothetical protein